MAASGLHSIAMTLHLISHERRLIAMRRYGNIIIREVRNRDGAEWIEAHSSEWETNWKATVRVEKRRRRKMGRNVNNAEITWVMMKEEGGMRNEE